MKLNPRHRQVISDYDPQHELGLGSKIVQLLVYLLILGIIAALYLSVD